YPRLQRWAITVAPVPSRIAGVESREPSLTTTRSEAGRCRRTRSTTLRMVAASLYAGMATSVRWRGAVDILMERRRRPTLAVLHKVAGRPTTTRPIPAAIPLDRAGHRDVQYVNARDRPGVSKRPHTSRRSLYPHRPIQPAVCD